MSTITDNRKVSDITIRELKDIIREIVKEASDPDSYYELNEDFLNSLKKSEADIKNGKIQSWTDVKSELEL